MTASTLEKNGGGGRGETAEKFPREMGYTRSDSILCELGECKAQRTTNPNFNSNLKILWLRQVPVERLAASLWNQCHILHRPGTLLLMFLCLIITGEIKFYHLFYTLCKYNTCVSYYTMLVQ